MAIAPYSTTTPETAINFWAQFYDFNAQQVYNVVQCESHFDPNAVGKLGELGLVQIFRKYHLEVTPEEAQDPDWALPWMLRQWKAGHASEWSCYVHLYKKNPPLPFSGPLLESPTDLPS